jgi:hypothetical protein
MMGSKAMKHADQTLIMAENQTMNLESAFGTKQYAEYTKKGTAYKKDTAHLSGARVTPLRLDPFAETVR